MKHLLALALATGTSLASAQTNVGVSVSVMQPGVYGRIDIGHVPPPPVVYAQPVLIAPARVRHEPLYLYVPPGHQKNWGKHCNRYRACGQPVYFVQERWVQERYEERHDRDRDHDDHDRGHKHGKKEKRHGKHGHD